MTELKYCILMDVRNEVDTGLILDHMKGYLNSNGWSISYSIMDSTVYLHYGIQKDLDLMKEYIESMRTTPYIINNWKAFSNAEKAFLYIDNKELFKVWLSE